MAYQNCNVHFMRNILAHISGRDKKLFVEKLKQIWFQTEYDSAKKCASLLMDEYETKYAEAISLLEEGLEDFLQFFNFDDNDSRKIPSTNILERLNREIRRKTKVVGIFPNMDSYIRLVTSYLIEYSEDWSSGRSYINLKSSPRFNFI